MLKLSMELNLLKAIIVATILIGLQTGVMGQTDAQNQVDKFSAIAGSNG